MKRATSRIMWTDEQKAEMIRATEGMGEGEIQDYLDGRGIQMLARSMRTLKTRYIKAHPEFDPAVPAKAAATATDFMTADRETRKRLIAEYLKIPKATGEKEAWLAQHNVKPATLHWWNKRLKERATKTAKPSKELAVREPMNGAQPKRGRPLKVEILPPKQPVVTLDDAILALEVERDHMNATIEKLKRMRSGY